ncbi:RND transporter [Asanoa ferruginea]|nr:RND transporter [Asanoa ferruginea]
MVNGLLVAALAGGGLWVYSSFAPADASDAGTAGGLTRTVAVSRGTVTATVSATGAVRSASTATASFGTSGTVKTIAVAVGTKVAKGTTLATIDDTAAKRQLAAAEDDLDAANDALDRASDAKGDTSAAQSQVDQAERDVDAARDAVAGTVLKAPMAGTVTAVNGTLGGPSSGSSSSSGGTSRSSTSTSSTTTTTTGSGFVTIEDLGHLEVAATVAEADATKLRKGQSATVTWNALPDARSDATLTAVDPTATTSGDVVTYGATLSLAKLPTGVRAGQTVQVSVVVGKVEDAVTVISAAVTGSGARHTVTVDQNGQHVTRDVQVGLEGGQTTQITSGLDVGEQVVITIPTGSGGGTQTGNQPGGGFRFPGGGGFTGGGATGGGFRGGTGGRQGAGR